MKYWVIVIQPFQASEKKANEIVDAVAKLVQDDLMMDVTVSLGEQK